MKDIIGKRFVISYLQVPPKVVVSQSKFWTAVQIWQRHYE